MFFLMIAYILISMCLSAKMAAVQALPHSGNPHRVPFNSVSLYTMQGRWIVQQSTGSRQHLNTHWWEQKGEVINKSSHRPINQIVLIIEYIEIFSKTNDFVIIFKKKMHDVYLSQYLYIHTQKTQNIILEIFHHFLNICSWNTLYFPPFV